ncbi:MAG: GGDEF domain-containing response regulator [Thermodesulfobacteriota bacterium]
MRTLDGREDTLRRITLLYVEDDAFTREQLGRLLARVTGKALPAADGQEGLRVFMEHRPDMVLTDLNMPVMDGLTMTAAIKAESPDTPVIAATAHNDENYLQRAIEVGMDGYVAKPIDLDKLRPVLHKNAQLVLQRREDEARNQLISYLLDINPQLIVSSAGGVIDYANKTLLHSAGHENLEEFLSGRQGLMDRLAIDGREYRLNDPAWIEAAASQDAPRVMAAVPPPEGRPGETNIFWIKARRFPGLDRIVATMTDITDLERERVQLLYQATTDNLTGLANRHKLFEHINAEHVRFRRYRTPMSLIMFDIDHFKKVNDTFGHAAGDQVLAGLAGEVAEVIRDTDTLGRWGGEEFMILAPLTPLHEAMDLAERLRLAVGKADFPVAGRITCSFGVAEMAEGESVDSLLRRVDAALYAAKNKGRNRVEGS